MVERRFYTADVAGSSPVLGTEYSLRRPALKFYLTNHVCISGNIYIKECPDEICRVNENGDIVVEEYDSPPSYYEKGSWFLSADDALVDAQRRKAEGVLRLEEKLENFKALGIKFVGSGS